MIKGGGWKDGKTSYIAQSNVKMWRERIEESLTSHTMRSFNAGGRWPQRQL